MVFALFLVFFAAACWCQPVCPTQCDQSTSATALNTCFIRTEGRACSGLNELGIRIGISLEQCAETCLQDASCISFERLANGNCQFSTSCNQALLTDFPNDVHFEKCVTAASAFGDPHFRGAHGEAYDLYGQDDGRYCLFSSNSTQVNIQLGHTADNHFIEFVELMHQGVHEQFTLAGQRNPSGFLKSMNRKFQKTGAKFHFIDGLQSMIRVQFCDGHELELHKMIAKHGGTHYFDVEFAAPGCHNDYDGVLGQTYKCKYALHKEKFVFDRSMEENFRVKTMGTPFGKYDAKIVVSCSQRASLAKEKAIKGKTHHSN